MQKASCLSWLSISCCPFETYLVYYTAELFPTEQLQRYGEILDQDSMLAGIDPKEYEDRLKSSWVYQELKSVRNVKPAIKKFGLWIIN